MYQPEIPQNVGAAVRLAAAMGCTLDLIEPFSFIFDVRRLGRAALDYHRLANLERHRSWAAFDGWRRAEGRRLVLLTTRAPQPYTTVSYASFDILLCGSESAGVPPEVHAAVDLRVAVPLVPAARSLNVVTALAMVTGEALRQLDAWPEADAPGGELP